MRMTLTRDFYAPKNAQKITHKTTNAVAYLYNNSNGQPCAMVFAPKGQKPAWCYRFKDAATREARVASFFKGHEEHKERVAKRRGERSKPHNLEVGHILYSSWGYDQTNIDWYQVTKVVGKNTVEIRPIAEVRHATGDMTGNCTPIADKFTGPAMRKRVSHGSVKIASYASAYVWDGRPKNWTAYA